MCVFSKNHGGPTSGGTLIGPQATKCNVYNIEPVSSPYSEIHVSALAVTLKVSHYQRRGLWILPVVTSMHDSSDGCWSVLIMPQTNLEVTLFYSQLSKVIFCILIPRNTSPPILLNSSEYDMHAVHADGALLQEYSYSNIPFQRTSKVVHIYRGLLQE